MDDFQDAIKAGQRNSQDDLGRLQVIHDMAVMNGAVCTVSEVTQMDAPGSKTVTVSTPTAAPEPLAMYGEAVKALGQGKVGGYLLRYSSKDDPDAEGEYFTADTDFGPHKSLPVYYHHGQDATLKARPIGQASVTQDEVGLWCEAQLAMRDRYERAIYKMAEDGKLGYSSGVLFHLMEREPVGKATHIKTWIIGEASLTPTPADPRNVALPIKSLPLPPALDGLLSTEDVMEVTEERLQEMLAEAAGAGAEKALKSLPAQPVAAGVTVVKDEADQPFTGMGEMLKAVRLAAIGEGEDVRLRSTKSLGINETTPSEGGYLVRPEYATRLLERTYETGQVLQRVTRDPVGAGANGMTYNAIDETSRANGSRYGGVQAYWKGEGTTGTATKPKFRNLELKLKKLLAFCYATDEQLQDIANLESWIMRAYPEEMGFVVEDSIFNGTGAGMPLGVLASGARVSVAKEVGQAAATLLWENIVKMWSRMWSRSRGNAAWFINQDIEPQLYTMSQVIGTGGQPVFLPPAGASASPYATLLGRPVIPVEYCATLGTQGDIMLADFSQYQAIDKAGIQSASSIHVQFLTDETTYRFTYRFDGQPVWNSPLTPKNGSNTLSPFVVLDTRA